jgi:nicotinamide-nucleotide amidase
MQAEILSIGSELTSGRNLDTNSQWLSRRLAESGIATGWHTIIADDFVANLEAFQIATRRAKLVIATGGLGPTQDDLTREVLAKLAGVDLVEDTTQLAIIQEMFRRRGRTMPERNKVQALFPVGSVILPNDRGTAPGIWMRQGDAWIAALPGVPTEMYAMYAAQVKPRLEELGLASGVRIQRKINTFGMGESHVEQKLFDLTARDHVPEVGITASDAIISLRILASGATTEEALAQAAPIERTIRERLGDFVFGVEDEELQDAVAALAVKHRLTISVAEGVSGGLLSDALVSVPGASAWYRGGIIAYDDRVKEDLLGVPLELMSEQGTVSEAVAKAMAAGCRTRLRTDLALATVGVAGPGAMGEDRPAGLVWVALSHEKGEESLSFSWIGNRTEVRRRTAKLALNLLRLHLLRRKL